MANPVIVSRMIRVHAPIGPSTQFDILVDDVGTELAASLEEVVDHMRQQFPQCETELLDQGET